MGWESHPVAICMDCDRPISKDNAQLVNEHCARRARGHQCKGFYSSTTDPNDWRRCGICHERPPENPLSKAPDLMGTPSGREYYLVRSLHLRRTEFSAHIVRIETGVGGIWPFNGAFCCSYFVLADHG
jgi:hypothetical protein